LAKIVVGAHLDSVPEGPGINDNGSGSAAVLEAALRLAQEPTQARSGVRFAFWGAEERGLIGSRHHVGSLSEAVRRHIARRAFDQKDADAPGVQKRDALVRHRRKISISV
jgi:Zn-dependent M28 family amino/carboxypeptidase